MKITFLNLFLAAIASLTLGCKTTSSEKDESAMLHVEIANAHIQKENYPLALKELLIAKDMSPKNPDILAGLGFVYMVREKYDLAEEHYKQAISLRPDFSDAKNHLASIYIQTSQNKLAEKLLTEVLADLTYVNFPRAYSNYGILEFNRHNYQQAIFYLKKSLDKDRENCLSHVYLGRSYLELKDFSIAISELDKSISFCKSVENDEAHYYSAIALYRNNQKDLAIFRFQELMKIFPNGKNFENAKKMRDVLKKGNL